MTLDAAEFIRRFLLHVLPQGFHRIRHYGLLANAQRQANLKSARGLLAIRPPKENNPAGSADNPVIGADRKKPSESTERALYQCPDCGAAMIVIDILGRGRLPRAPPPNLKAA